MFCTRCGSKLLPDSKFCSSCGHNTAAIESYISPAVPPRARVLSRPRNNRRIAGVCAAFAEYLDLDVTLVRVLWLVAVLIFGTGVLAYLVAWIVLPNELPATAIPAR